MEAGVGASAGFNVGGCLSSEGSPLALHQTAEQEH